MDYNDIDGQVLLVFHKSDDGYTYEYPVYAKKERGSKCDLYIVTKGINAGKVFSMTSCFDSKGLLDKLLNGGGPYSFVPLVKHEYSDYIAVVLDSNIKNHLFDMLKNKKNLDEDILIVALLDYGDKIGKAINKIDKKYLGDYYTELANNFEDSLNDKETKKNLPERAVAEASAFFNKNYNNVTIHSDARKIVDSIFEKNIYKVEEKDNSVNEESIKVEKKNQIDAKAMKAEIEKNSQDKVIDVKSIKAEIRKRIISQDNAIDVVVNNIYFNQRYIDTGDADLLRNKANILLEGATGTGKTFIVEEVANRLNVPIYVTPATGYSSVGYRGADLSDILCKLLEKANGKLELAERGIIALDEFDKLGSSGDQDISMRRAIQQELLSFISGTFIDVTYKGKNYSFDTSKLTFIAMGAFTDLRERKISENEKKGHNAIGFVPRNEDFKRTYVITKDDYINEGLARELIGRFSCLVYTNDLSVKDLEKILCESIASPLNGLKMTGNIMKCKVVIPPEIVHEIAQMAFDSNTGARGLNEIVQSLKDVVANDLFSGKPEIVITKEHLEKSRSIKERIYHVRKEL